MKRVQKRAQLENQLRRTIVIDEIDRLIVDRESQRLGLYNFSAAVRSIIRDWAQMKHQALRNAVIHEDRQSQN